MANKKKPDTHVPNPLADAEYQSMIDYLTSLTPRLSGLYSISTDDVKGFKKVSRDETDFINDVITEMSHPSNGVASNVQVKNIQAARAASPQFEKLGNLYMQVGQLFLRNAMQADSYAYQHSSVFEADVQNAIDMDVKGAVEIKERLESNRKKRNAASAATRQATAARLAEEKALKEATKTT
jgi:hypothetical protein